MVDRRAASSTPSMRISSVPAPSMRAPICRARSASSSTSGSRARSRARCAPSASAAAIITFSVPVTVDHVEGDRRRPRSRSARAPRRSRARARSRRPAPRGPSGAGRWGARRWRSRRAARPGPGRSARAAARARAPRRASSSRARRAPRASRPRGTRIATACVAPAAPLAPGSPCGASSREHGARRRRGRARCGRGGSPSASSAAARMGSAAFFAPETCTVAAAAARRLRRRSCPSVRVLGAAILGRVGRRLRRHGQAVEAARGPVSPRRRAKPGLEAERRQRPPRGSRASPVHSRPARRRAARAPRRRCGAGASSPSAPAVERQRGSRRTSRESAGELPRRDVGRVRDDRRRTARPAAPARTGRPASEARPSAARAPRRSRAPRRARPARGRSRRTRGLGPLERERDARCSPSRCTGRARAAALGQRARAPPRPASSVSGRGNEHARVDPEGAAVELARAGEVGGGLAGGAPPDELAVGGELGLAERLVEVEVEPHPVAGEHVGEQHLGGEPGRVDARASRRSPASRRGA